MFKSITSKRILAYIVDIFIVTLISSMFAGIEFLNPYLEKQNEVTIEYNEKFEEYISQTEDINELSNSEFMTDYTYDVSYYGVYTSIITLIVTILYFVVFQYYNEGKTIGKALFDIIVVDKNIKRVKINHLLIRSLIIHSIITNTILIISIFLLKKDAFLVISNIIGIIEMGIIIICIIMIMFRKDKRLIHDLLAGTKVISREEYEEKQTIKEATILEKNKKKTKKRKENK